MFGKHYLLLGALLAFPASSYAILGGPWDNSDYSATLDNVGIYQVAMRFKNGSGFAQWGNNVNLAPAVSAGTGGGGATAIPTLGTPANRSVIYHEGIVYVGNATGIVDHDREKITGITNSYSNLTSTSSTTSGGGTVTASATVASNSGISSTANSFFDGHIYEKAPILKFNGNGELSILTTNPNATAAATAVNSLIASLNAVAATTGTPPTPASFPSAASITNVSNLIAQIKSDPNLGVDPASRTSVVHMKVFGSRVFFIGSR